MLLKETSFTTQQQGHIWNQHQAEHTGVCHDSYYWEQTILSTDPSWIQNHFGGQFSCGQ